jgi:HSP20 family molecular chaperone IbpA
MVKRNPAITELLRLQEDLNHLLCDLTVRVSGEFLGSANHWVPNIDLSEDAGEIVVKAEVPGVAQADLEIVFQEGCYRSVEKSGSVARRQGSLPLFGKRLWQILSHHLSDDRG